MLLFLKLKYVNFNLFEIFLYMWTCFPPLIATCTCIYFLKFCYAPFFISNLIWPIYFKISLALGLPLSLNFNWHFFIQRLNSLAMEMMIWSSSTTGYPKQEAPPLLGLPMTFVRSTTSMLFMSTPPKMLMLCPYLTRWAHNWWWGEGGYFIFLASHRSCFVW